MKTMKLKLGPIADDKPVKIAVELPASLHRDLVSYGRLLAEGGAPIEPAKFTVPTLEKFVATDRRFAKAKRQPRST
jgi:hypothetical protein